MSIESLLTSYDITEIRENEGGYNYFGFSRGDGTWRILREKTDGTEYRFAIGGKDFVTNFSNRASLSYKAVYAWPKA